jgi:2-polyprenyl-6-methoxyphenol hydroxylase-like FAD-dependent oxidoreductase
MSRFGRFFMDHFDAVIVGYGPTGKVLARLLSDRGHKVAVVDQWPAAYALPRAVGFDHEINRMFHSLGLSRQVSEISRPMHHYVWYNADWEVLVDINHSTESPSGGSIGYLFNQPELEEILDADLRKRGRVAHFLGRKAVEVSQYEDHATVLTQPFDVGTLKPIPGDDITITARYVIGCDGANSVVRQALGSDQEDLGFDAEWLVVDVRPNDISELPIPDAAQWCNPSRPTTIVPSGKFNRRWEFMLLPGEKAEEMASPAAVWRLLDQWIKPDQGQLVRSAVYRFRSLLEHKWRNGRLLIAGDAAHRMPPFMGQGMCSGLRDAWTLAWQLDLVMNGVATSDLLDNYERERRPHAEMLIRLSMEMGKIVCVSDLDAARQRDLAFKQNPPPPPPEPKFFDGVVMRDHAGKPHESSGVLLPHVTLEKDGVSKRMDDITGRNFVLLVDAGLGTKMPGADAAALLESIGGKILVLGAGGYKDTEGRLTAYMSQHGLVGILARPDFYAFALCKSADDITAAVHSLKDQLCLVH